MKLLPASMTRTNGEASEAAETFSARAQRLLTALNLHYAGAVVLALLNVYLLVQLGVAWHEKDATSEEAFAQQRVALKMAQIAARPLEGLDAKLADAKTEANGFTRQRLPYSYSQVAAELGVLAKRTTVRLSGINYAPVPVLEGDGALTEVNMDARMSGDYRSLMEFINGLERDKQFFLIDGITLTGAQSGTVNLRLKLTTYLRPPATEDEMKRVTALPAAATDAAAAGGRP